MVGKEDALVAEMLDATEAQVAISKVLVKLGLVKPDLLSGRIAFQEYSPIAYFSSLGLFDEWHAIVQVAQHLKIQPYKVEKSDQENISKLLDSTPLKHLSLLKWKKSKVLPLAVWGQEVLVSMANPLDLDAIKQLEFDLDKKLRIVIGLEKEILQVLNGVADPKDGLDFNSLLKEESAPKIKHLMSQQVMDTNTTPGDISAPVIVRLVNQIFSGAIQKRASDIHISPEQDKLSVRIRVDGIIRCFLDVPGNYKEGVVARIKVLSGMDISEKRQPQDGRLRVKTNLGSRDLRISTIPTVYGENLVARILASEIGKLSLESIGLPEIILQNYDKLLQSSSRVNLVAGPTGSGKTSTLYASIIRLNDGTSHIITVEDPIEYRIAGVNQVQVNTKTGMTFGAALRSMLRQDPDIIMVGEIRDSETASTAMQMAQTGHLVFSTIHTNTACAAITRLRDLEVPSFLIASSLGSVLAQRLVRRLCAKCATPVLGDNKHRLAELGFSDEGIMQANGCEECDGSGYHGQIGIFSLLEVVPPVAAAIRENRAEVEIEAIGKEFGFQSLTDAALKLVTNGLTTFEELERVLGVIEIEGSITRDVVNLSQSKKIVLDQAYKLNTDDNSVIPRRKILIVDDDDNIRDVYKMVLEYEMFEVEQASDGIEALQKIYEGRPELIVLDLMMPKMSGLEMLEKLRANPKTREIPVLMLTAAATEENEVMMLKSGADDFVNKTSRSDVIVARINKLLNRDPIKSVSGL